jgi:adenosylmethionine-8-amino-7-oxononanoate aminotransferase
LAYLEETILQENPNTIAGLMIETVCGSSGVLINPSEVMHGI